MKYLTKVANAETEWAEKASIIRSGGQKSMLTILEERGLVKSITGYYALQSPYSMLLTCEGTVMLLTST